MEFMEPLMHPIDEDQFDRVARKPYSLDDLGDAASLGRLDLDRVPFGAWREISIEAREELEGDFHWGRGSWKSRIHAT